MYTIKSLDSLKEYGSHLYSYNKTKEFRQVIKAIASHDPEYVAKHVYSYDRDASLRKYLISLVPKNLQHIPVRNGFVYSKFIPDEEHKDTIFTDAKATSVFLDSYPKVRFKEYIEKVKLDDVIVPGYTIDDTRIIRHLMHAGAYKFIKNHINRNESALNYMLIYYIEDLKLGYIPELAESINYAKLKGTDALDLLKCSKEYYKHIDSGRMPMSFHKEVRRHHPDLYEETAHLMSSLLRKGK